MFQFVHLVGIACAGYRPYQEKVRRVLASVHEAPHEASEADHRATQMETWPAPPTSFGGSEIWEIRAS